MNKAERERKALRMKVIKEEVADLILENQRNRARIGVLLKEFIEENRK